MKRSLEALKLQSFKSLHESRWQIVKTPVETGEVILNSVDADQPDDKLELIEPIISSREWNATTDTIEYLVRLKT